MGENKVVEDRSERSRRLVQIGAIVEKYLGINSIEEAEALGQVVTQDSIRLSNLQRMVKAKAAQIKALE